MGLKGILPVLLILSLLFASVAFSETHAQVQYSLNLQRITWNHSTLRVLIIPPSNESWWAPSYLNATFRAVREWNQAILGFALNYTDYAYLSKLRITQTVAYTKASGFDVYISWTETPPYAADEIGYTNTLYNMPSRIIVNSTIDLASKTLQGYVLDEVDMHNVILHEFGHSLGLGHSNFTDDSMYPTYSLNPLKQVQTLSTLDLYGVSIVFQWMSNSSYPYSPQQSSVTLPSSIPYGYLPTSEEDLLPASPYSSLWQTLLTYIQKLINYTSNLVTRPEFLILLGILVLLVIVFLFARPKKAEKTTQVPTSSSFSYDSMF